ncbi:ADP-ribosylation factor-like protein 7 [Elsinoe australis]|uniref:ADP-ribosylation factor-like protein 7 n=1 Tax=Elsinoe australis TaxID=40998 RepID=A0A4U7AT16_9PEZI|nr:ADP-ribosylation factor-like protein 7 [Elsinoe australis]
MVKDYVRENSDGVMFVVDAAMHGEENQTNEDYILSEYMLNLEETQDGVLVVLVDRAEEEGAKSIEEIENQIRALLENQGRDRQRHAVFPIAAQAGTGLARALQWFADELNKTAMEGG